MKVYSYQNNKGGVGKTTSSINHAVGLANKGYRVLLVDLDPQANATCNFVEETELYIDDLFKDPERTAEAIVQTKHSGLDLIASRLKFSMIDMWLKLSNDIMQHECLQSILDQVSSNYDYCIIDCPPIQNIITINALLVSDVVVVPIKIDRYAISGYSVTLENINHFSTKLRKKIDFKILFTMVNGRSKTEAEIMQKIREISRNHVLNTTIRIQTAPVINAPLNDSILINNKSAKVAKEYVQLVEELLKGISQ